MTPSFVIVGIENTICASWRREDLIQSHGWDRYHEDGINDAPIKDIIELINCLRLAGFKVIGLTDRNRSFWPMTLTWLVKNNVNIDTVLMRPDDDFQPAIDIKKALTVDFFGGEERIKAHVAMVIDSNDAVIQYFTSLGVTTLHCQPRRL